MRSCRRLSAGFSLVEVIVAVALLGGVITALLIARSQAQASHLTAARMMVATRLAASMEVLVRSGKQQAGEGVCNSPSGYRWRIEEAARDEGAPKDVRMYTVRVWPEDMEEQAGVTLNVWVLDRAVEVTP